MKRVFVLTLLIILTTNLIGQVSFGDLLNAIDGLDNGYFSKILKSNNFNMSVPDNKNGGAKWEYSISDNKKQADIIIETKTSPVKSIWLEFYNFSIYESIEEGIRKSCTFEGAFGCAEVETWDSYKHSSGLEFKLIQFPDSMEKGQLIIEITE